MAFTDWYYGIDTNSSTFPCAGDGSNFYIGNIGSGTTASMTDFNTTAADAVGTGLTFSYWTILGPNSAPPGTGPSDWGVDQANAFLSAWDTNTYSDGSTFFGDVETGDGFGTNTTDNKAVLHGFLYTLYTTDDVVAGLYISTDNYTTYFGAYNPGIPFVFWLAGTPCTATTCAAAATYFNDNLLSTAVGGYKAMIWQYVTPGCTGFSEDYDITPYTGYQDGQWNPVAS